MFDKLPAEGYAGPVPEFPLPRRAVTNEITTDSGGRIRLPDEAATQAWAEREAEVWAWAWSTPQACAWSQPSESWRLMTVAMWVRTFVLCESSEATAADKNALHRFADQIGMTPAGLRENGWQVAKDDLAAKSAERAKPTEEGKPARRMRAVP